MTSGASWHVITSEYPPRMGGVSDFSAVAAMVLAERGDPVHVWTGGDEAIAGPPGEPIVHPIFGDFGRTGRARVGQQLDAIPGRRTLLVQWVPHGYSRRGMNVGFALWLRQRARRGDRLMLVIHEPFVSDLQRPAHVVIAAVQRLMAAIALRRAERVFVTIPAWEQSLRPWAFGRKLGWEQIPLPPAIAVAANEDVGAVRARLAKPGQMLIGHFGACGGPMLQMLQQKIPPLLRDQPEAVVVLIGRDGEAARESIIAGNPQLKDRLLATGPISAPDISLHLQACDLFIQPYPDGVSGRRTSAIAALHHGKAVITTEGHLTESYWRASGAVVLVPVDDSAEMVARSRELLRSPDRRAALERRAKTFSDQRFSRQRLSEVLPR